ncbi:hypothetical protein [Streptomyces sp. NPDC048508]|uniref:hypothetical protein n=1 Tax=Streptomyces sp. NPDC048508 TaxID=3365561 RepID=UPI003721E533
MEGLVLYVITGPPAAGKSSWIKAHATARDIVIDVDFMALAMVGPGADHLARGDVLMGSCTEPASPRSTRRISTSTGSMCT